MTGPEIAELYDASLSAVRNWKRDDGLSSERTDWLPQIFGKMKREHKDNPHAEMLRHYFARESGRELPEQKARSLALWEAKRAEEGTVVAYSRELGFYLVPAEERDGGGYVRRPDVDPDARRVQFVEP